MLIFVLALLAGIEPSDDGALALERPKLDAKACTYRRTGTDPKDEALRLFGRFQLVKDRPDLRIQIVKVSPDLRVRRVRTTADPTECGEWRFMRTRAVRVQIVKSSPDLRVQYVEHDPGIPAAPSERPAQSR